MLDRYGHLFPGHEEAVLARLEGMATSAAPTVDAEVITLRPGEHAATTR